MKFMAICGSGLGSSFMVEMNINKVLGELGVSGVEVEHSDVSSAHPGAADVFFLARDIADGLNLAPHQGRASCRRARAQVARRDSHGFCY